MGEFPSIMLFILDCIDLTYDFKSITILSYYAMPFQNTFVVNYSFVKMISIKREPV
jgi:hypothetical protein